MALTVEVPESVAEVVAMLGEDDVVIAGGTEVMPRVTTRATGVERLVSLRRTAWRASSCRAAAPSSVPRPRWRSSAAMSGSRC